MDKKRAEQLARIGCIVCRGYGRYGVPAEVHHLTGIKYRATGKKADDAHTIPLCPHHHRLGPFGEAVHNGVKTFEAIHGTQEHLLAVTDGLIEHYGRMS